MVLKRFVKGIDQEAFFQKRAPENRPDLIETATLHYARGTSAEEVGDPGCRGPRLGRQPRLPRPQPAPGARRGPRSSRRAAGRPRPDARASTGRRSSTSRMVAREVLDRPRAGGVAEDVGLTGHAHLCAHRAALGLHGEVRLAAETLAREVENRAPGLATARWWKEERGESVFVDFNQNAKDRTVASAYSIRPAARRAGVDAARLGRGAAYAGPSGSPCATVLERFAERGDPAAGIDDAIGALDGLLALAKQLGPSEKPPRASGAGGTAGGSGRRQSTMPLIEIARAKTKPEALEGLERWKARHADVVALLQPADVLVDGMRGEFVALVPHPREPAARPRGVSARRRASRSRSTTTRGRADLAGEAGRLSPLPALVMPYSRPRHAVFRLKRQRGPATSAEIRTHAHPRQPFSLKFGTRQALSARTAPGPPARRRRLRPR